MNAEEAFVHQTLRVEHSPAYSEERSVTLRGLSTAVKSRRTAKSERPSQTEPETAEQNQEPLVYPDDILIKRK